MTNRSIDEEVYHPGPVENALFAINRLTRWLDDARAEIAALKRDKELTAAKLEELELRISTLKERLDKAVEGERDE